MEAPPAYAEPNSSRIFGWSGNDGALDGDYKYSFEKPEKPTPSPSYEESFPIARPKYNDVFFTYTFLATVAVFACLTYESFVSSGSFGMELVDYGSISTNKMSKATKALYTLITVSTATPLLCSLALLLLAYLFPTVFILVAFLLAPLSLFAMAVSSLMAGSVFSALLLGGLGALSLLFMFQNFNRFSFSALMLKLVISAMRKYPSTILISVLSSVTTALASLAYMLAFAIIMNSRTLKDDANCPHPNGNEICLSNTSIAVLLYAVFAGCYIFQVIENTTHVVLSGIFSSWYFFDSFDSASKPKHPAIGSLKRAFTYCFGSICFGSLLVSVVQTVRVSLQLLKSKLQNARLSRNDTQNDDSPEFGLLFCFLLCIVSVLEWITSEFEYWMKWFNRYAYSYLAMYGKPYLSSARDTFEILKYKGIDILINDSLIGSAIGLYALLSMLVTALTLYLTFNTSELLHDMGPEMLVLGGVASIVICWFIVSTAINVLDVGCVTFMIGLAVDPDAFTRTDAGGASDSNIERLQAWEQMVRFYPGVRERVTLAWPQNSTV